MMYRRARGLPASDTGTSTSLTPNVPFGPGAAEGLDEVAALATGLKRLKIPAARANTMKLIERRTCSPWLLVRAAPQPGPRRRTELGNRLGERPRVDAADRGRGNRDRDRRIPPGGVVADSGGSGYHRLRCAGQIARRRPGRAVGRGGGDGPRGGDGAHGVPDVCNGDDLSRRGGAGGPAARGGGRDPGGGEQGPVVGHDDGGSRGAPSQDTGDGGAWRASAQVDRVRCGQRQGSHGHGEGHRRIRVARTRTR